VIIDLPTYLPTHLLSSFLFLHIHISIHLSNTQIQIAQRIEPFFKRALGLVEKNATDEDDKPMVGR
jgi:hypothetical protein